MSPAIAQPNRSGLEQLCKQFDELTSVDQPRETFHNAWLRELMSHAFATGGVLRLRDREGNWTSRASSSFPEMDCGTEELPTRHGRLLFETFVTGRPKTVPPQIDTGRDLDANPTTGLLLMAPVRIGMRILGVVELVLPLGLDADRQLEILAAIQESGKYLEQFEERQRLHQQRRREIVADAVETFCRSVYRYLTVEQTAYEAANEGKKLLGCERLTVVVRRGQRFHVRAVSGLDVVEPRSEAAKELAAMAQKVTSGREVVHYPPNESSAAAPQIQAAVGGYVDRSFARRVAVLPLVPETRGDEQHGNTAPIGALVAEWFSDATVPPGFSERCRFAADHATAALDKARQLERIPGYRAWMRVAAWRQVLEGAGRLKSSLVGAVLVALLLTLTFVPADFTIHASGKLNPARNQFAFAPSDGIVERVLVRHGQRVHIGQPLVELRNPELEVQLADLAGRRRAAIEQLSGVERSLFEDSSKLTIADRHRLSGDRSKLRQEVASYDEQLRLLEKKKSDLIVRSPLDGDILSWDLAKTLLYRPVQIGQSLLEIGDTAGEWVLELEVPEADVGHIVDAERTEKDPLRVRYRLAGEPDRDYVAQVQEIQLAADVRGEAGNTVLVRASLVPTDLPPTRAGAEGVAKVQCGRRSLGYVWLHDVVDFLRTKVWFRLT